MIRKANPEIARGKYTALRFEDTRLGGFTAEYSGSTVAVFHNTTSEELSVDLSQATDLSFTEVRSVIGSGTALLNGSNLTLGIPHNERRHMVQRRTCMSQQRPGEANKK